MNTTLFLTLALLPSIAPLYAAETDSAVRWSSSGPRVAQGRGQGDWVETQTLIEKDFSRGSALATDDDSISFSNTSVFRGAGRQMMGNTLNITVGLGRGSASPGYGHSAGPGMGMSIRGHSNPHDAGAIIHARGQFTRTTTRAIRFP